MKRLILIFVLCGLLLPSAYGETISYTFPSGNKYVGEVKISNGTGKKHGQGTLIFGKGEFEGNQYDGEFKDDKKHGQGTHTWANGDKYVGEWKDDKRHGQGTSTYADGSKNVGEYRYGFHWRGAEYDASGKVIKEKLDGMPAPACNGKQGGRIWGTGFAVNQYHVVTNAHVLYCCKKVTVLDLSCSESEEATVVSTEQKSDLGLLRLDRPLKHYATLRSGKELQLGEAVLTYDRKSKENDCLQYVFGQGKVTKLNWMPDDSRMMVHDSPISKGSSGGPVLDSSGHIVGVTQARRMLITNRHDSYAVKSHLLKTFLESNSVEYKTTSSMEKLSPSEIKKKPDKFTVIIKCLP